MIRKATLQDLDVLVPFAQRTFEAAFGAIWNPVDMAEYFATSYSHEGLGKELGSPDESFWFLEEGDQLLGFLQMQPHFTVPHIKGENPIYLHRLYVDDTQTGKGMGSRLLQHAVNEAERGGHDAIWLTVWDMNPRAVALYRKWQFRKMAYVAFPLGSDVEPTDYLMQRDMGNVRVVPFAPEFAASFKELNLAWLHEYFSVEPLDELLLGDPQRNIIDKGGEIFLLLDQGAVKGTCALIPEHEGVFELGKMAVRAEDKGRGFANLLMDAAIAHTHAERASKIVLTSNSKLTPALKLYEKYGFRTTWTGQHSEYARGDIGMALDL